MASQSPDGKTAGDGKAISAITIQTGTSIALSGPSALVETEGAGARRAIPRNFGAIRAGSASQARGTTVTRSGVVSNFGILRPSAGSPAGDGVDGAGAAILDTSLPVNEALIGLVDDGFGNAAKLDLTATGALANTGTLDIGGGNAVLNAADSNPTVKLEHATDLTLGAMSFITAIGSDGSDTIAPGGAGQTLTGGLGHDTLIGSAAVGDTFRDTALGLNGDVIGDFAGTEALDITDIAAGSGLSPTYAQHGDSRKLTLAHGSAGAAISLLGTYASGDFATAGDGHGGVAVTLGQG